MSQGGHAVDPAESILRRIPKIPDYGLVQTRVTLGGVKPWAAWAVKSCSANTYGRNNAAIHREKCYPGSERAEPGPDYYNPSLPTPMLALAFRPNKQDNDGISLYREFFLTVDRLAGSARKPAEFYVVARFRAADLFAMGLSLLPTQEEGDLPGHVVVPELTWAAYQDPPRRRWLAEINRELAVLASRDIITEFQQSTDP
jgi:hypothetical protein